MTGGGVGAGVAAAAAAATTWRRGASGVVNWFPGHMAKATREIRETLRRVDLVVEVRDARIPLSSANEQLMEIVSHKRRLVVLNKMDLANQNLQRRWNHYFEGEGLRHLFVNAHRPKSVNQLLSTVRLILEDERAREDSLMVMIIGIPNVGKSAIINGIYRLSTGQSAQSKGPLKTAKIGPLPGVTREVACFKVGEAPSTYVMDTPGIMVPNVNEMAVGLKLALTGAVKDSVVGEERLGRYLLHMLNLCNLSNKGGWRKASSSLPSRHDNVVNGSQPPPLQPSDDCPPPDRTRNRETASDRLSPGRNMSQPPRSGVRNKVPWLQKDMATRSAAAITEVLVMSPEELGLAAASFETESGEEQEDALERQIDMQMYLLRRRFKVPMEKGDSGWEVVGRRILQAYRAGSLGRYTLDVVPE